MVDLLDQITWPSVECLNAHPDHSLDNALKQGYREDAGLYLESDTDEQLLLHIPFGTAVRLSGIVIQTKEKREQAPSHIKLFVNRPSLGFSEAADEPAQADFVLTDAQLAGETVPLMVARFSRVSHLTIFVDDNAEDTDTTVIEKIQLLGSGGDSFNVAEIKDISKDQS